LGSQLPISAPVAYQEELAGRSIVRGRKPIPPRSIATLMTAHEATDDDTTKRGNTLHSYSRHLDILAAEHGNRLSSGQTVLAPYSGRPGLTTVMLKTDQVMRKARRGDRAIGH
jgi:hypothetical protein